MIYGILRIGEAGEDQLHHVGSSRFLSMHLLFEDGLGIVNKTLIKFTGMHFELNEVLLSRCRLLECMTFVAYSLDPQWRLHWVSRTSQSDIYTRTHEFRQKVMVIRVPLASLCCSHDLLSSN
jgi:hypothetical protein